MQLEFAMEESRGNQLPGERFCPMEDELLLFYLKPLLSGQKVPGRNIVVFDCDLYGHQEPWEIWDDYKTKTPNDLRLNKDIYFFTQLKKMNSTGKRIRRTVGSGTWHENVSGKPVKSCETGDVVGSKKIFSYDNKASVHHGCWILYEFSLHRSLRDNKEKMKDTVLCLLRKNGEPESKIEKKRKEREEEEVLESNYVCDDGVHSNTEQEEFLEPRTKRQLQTISSIENTPLPTPSEDDALLDQLEETLERFEDDHSSSEAEASFQGEENGGLQRLASEVQSGPSFGDNCEVLYPLPDEDFAIEECLEELANVEAEEQNLDVINNTLLHQPPRSTMFASCDGFDMSYLSFQNIGTDSAGSNSVCGGSIDFQNGADLGVESLGKQQLVPEPQPREESLGQQYCQMPTFSVNEMAGGLDFHQDENLVQQMGGEGLGEVDQYGGYCSDSMLDEMLMSFAEELMNDGQPNTMEVGEWNAGYSDF